MISANEIRQKYLKFFESRGHKIIPSAPLIPENDPTTLFTSSGMQPLVLNLLGQPHPSGTRLVNSQKCIRTQDIEEVGDNRHTTFFEMLGNWSLGDYFKEEQLAWFYEFLTSEVSLSKDRLYVSVFEGDVSVPRDDESAGIWKKLGISENKIFHYGVKKNWWSRSGVPDLMPAGEPGGPDSEVFYEFTEVPHDPKFGSECHPNCECGRFLEIGNSVFMQYQKQADGSLKELPQKNVDFGGGLERLTAAAYNDPDIFKTDFFISAKKVLEDEIIDDSRGLRIILDHIRAAMFLIDSGVAPSNKDKGYVLRRLIRRAAAHAKIANCDLENGIVTLLTSAFVNEYSNTYPTLLKNKKDIIDEIENELTKFNKTLEAGIKLLGNAPSFDLYQSYGFPREVIEDLYEKRNIEFDENEFEAELKEHQDLSRTASKGMFKGGLQDRSEITTKYHTATHLLHAALRQVLGDHVHQAGSNITAERLRFDFSHPDKLTNQQIIQVEELINQKIAEDIPVTKVEMQKKQALAEGALAFFPEKYPDIANVYSIGGFSKELCGGPHVNSTAEIGSIKIFKEESLGSGTRRIYARIV
ncbi:MAG TPA: alanine--tRNA ligase [Patescibacteria group bacterium]|nr:alanine--tRNA ligase [Patescibacteria group bacterium]